MGDQVQVLAIDLDVLQIREEQEQKLMCAGQGAASEWSVFRRSDQSKSGSSPESLRRNGFAHIDCSGVRSGTCACCPTVLCSDIGSVVCRRILRFHRSVG